MVSDLKVESYTEDGTRFFCTYGLYILAHDFAFSPLPRLFHAASTSPILDIFFPTSARKQNNPLPPCASASRLEEGGGANNGELGSVGWEPAPCQSTCFQKVEGVHMVDPPADEFDLAGTDVMPACFSANAIQSGKDQSAL